MGASWVRSNVLEANPDAPIRVYAVWVTQRGATRSDIDPTLFGDERVTNFWDPDGLAGDALAELVDHPGGVVWDVYALFGPDARWEQRPSGLVGSGGTVIGKSDDLEREVAGLLGKT